MKFYHATSSIFLSSIRRSGLGTINPNRDLRHLELLSFLFDLAETHLSGSLGYLKLREITKAMVEQASREFRIGKEWKMCHFRHHNIHVALSIDAALSYARTNEYGSEILERCITLYRLLLEVDAKFQLPTSLNISRIDLLEKVRPWPVLVEILNVEARNLLREGGASAIAVLEHVRNNFARWNEEERWNELYFLNFEILKPIDCRYLKFYRIEFGQDGRSDEMSYSLFEI